MDYFSKLAEAYGIPDHEAETVAGVLVREFFTRFGIPGELHSDQGWEIHLCCPEGCRFFFHNLYY